MLAPDSDVEVQIFRGEGVFFGEAMISAGFVFGCKSLDKSKKFCPLTQYMIAVTLKT